MKFLLDTNIVSELRKGQRADAGVQEWFSTVESEDLALSILALGEIQLGILRLRRRDEESADHLSTWLAELRRTHSDRTLPVTADVVEIWARWNAVRSLSVIDSLQAATAFVHGLTFVTRDVDDLEGVTVRLLNPFSAV